MRAGHKRLVWSYKYICVLNKKKKIYMYNVSGKEKVTQKKRTTLRQLLAKLSDHLSIISSCRLRKESKLFKRYIYIYTYTF